MYWFKGRAMLRLLLLIFVIFSRGAYSQSTTNRNILQGNEVADPTKFPYEKLILDRFRYEDRVYSSASKTELGDSVELEMGARYQKDKNSFVRFRFITDPSENRKNNQTSNFETIYNRRFKKLTFQIDLDLNTNEGDSGAVALGLDLDSDDTYISYLTDSSFEITFFPFNFRSDIGEEFNTRDVTRISYIEGSPVTILAIPATGEEVVTKTIPGLEVKYNLENSYLYAGFGIASYLYPTNSNFDIQTNPVATFWERKEVEAFKFGYLYNVDGEAKLNIQFISQDKSNETGALIEDAGSISYFQRFSNFHIKTEFTATKAGAAPYRISRSTNWFEDVALNRPVYSDLNGDAHDWIGKSDQAYLLKLGYKFNDTLSYLSFKYQGEYFIYNEQESAHRLRIDDNSKSHGGLTRVALGSYFYYEQLFFNPQIEYQKASNPVFSNSTDVATDRLQSSFRRENILLTMNLTFSYDGANLSPNWWF